MNDLDRAIAEAREADRALAELEAKRAALPGLLAQKQREEAQQRAAEVLGMARNNAIKGRAAYVERAAAFAPEFELLVADAKMLAGKLREMQAPIHQLAAELTGAIRQAERAELPTDHPAGTWAAIGWADVPEVLPRGDGTAGHVSDLAERIAAALALAAGVNVYVPSKGIRGAGISA